MFRLLRKLKTQWGLIALFAFVLVLLASSSVTARELGMRAVNAPQADTTVYLPLVLSRSRSGSGSSIRTVNATYFNSTIVARAMGVFWFGRINSVENYADVRVGYNADGLMVDINIFDRYLWYDKVLPVENLTEWDTVTLFLSVSPNPGNVPTPTEYKFVAQLNHWEDRDDYQTFYRGNGAGWSAVSLPAVTTESEWHGEGFNNRESDKGWGMRYMIPFEALGYASPPHGAVWRLGMLLYDRDDLANTPIADKFWPKTFQPLAPETWGGLHFGQAEFTPPALMPTDVTTIKQGLNGAIVPDAHVGGAFNCGADVDHWTEWGDTNYESGDLTQINIQNQELIADWPCFSKYFVTFPLDVIPAGSIIVSATLTMNHFGNSGGGEFDDPLHSWIQVLTIADDWVDTTITWNNAPLAYENITMMRVDPLDAFPGWPGIPISLDVSLAVDAAHRLGIPLRLALYSADSAMHSGKYFYSSDSNSDARPVLTVYWKNTPDS